MILSIILGYVIGSISFTALTARIHNIKLGQIGSGNLGTTNLSRALGWKVAIVAGFLDVIKTFVVIAISYFLFKLSPFASMVAGVATILGHIYPFWNKFKGGKGVAATLGFAFATQNIWTSFIILAIMFYINKSLKLMILATLIALTSILILSWFSSSSILMNYEKGLAFKPTLFLWIIIMWKHRENFARWINGQENTSGKSN